MVGEDFVARMSEATCGVSIPGVVPGYRFAHPGYMRSR
jgi:hypothetical protein